MPRPSRCAAIRPPASIASTRSFYHDFRAGVTLPIPYKPELTAGVNNAFNAGPPTCVSCSLNGYDASNYDLPGRFAYVQATVKF